MTRPPMIGRNHVVLPRDLYETMARVFHAYELGLIVDKPKGQNAGVGERQGELFSPPVEDDPDEELVFENRDYTWVPLSPERAAELAAEVQEPDDGSGSGTTPEGQDGLGEDAVPAGDEVAS